MLGGKGLLVYWEKNKKNRFKLSGKVHGMRPRQQVHSPLPPEGRHIKTPNNQEIKARYIRYHYGQTNRGGVHATRKHL